MARPVERWERGLDQPGSADASTYRRGIAFATVLVVATAVVVAYGDVPLAPVPPFATFQAAFVLVVDVITGWMLLGQFRYRRRPLFALLGCAYLFSGFVLLPFLLSFPGALRPEGGVIGGPQSAVWIWHLWHILFPGLIALALAIERKVPELRVRLRHTASVTRASIVAAIALALVVGMATTAGHDDLPALLAGTPGAPTQAFFPVGILAAAITAAAMMMAGHHGWRKRSQLHLWLAVALLALLADESASLAATQRFTVGWYFGRVESMFAASVLLMVLLGRINQLYQRLAAVMRTLSTSHARLIAVLEEKNALVESLRRSEEQVRQMAYFDPLTGLPNRRLLLDRLAQARSLAARRHTSMAIMFMDLDRFKAINDTLGHDAGDELLRKVSERLTQCVRAGDTVARSGGDEFVVVLAEVSAPADAARVADKVIRALVDPVAVGEHRLQVTTSIGISIYPDDGDDMLQLMRKADQAMYAAKEAGRNAYRFYGKVVTAAD